MDNSGYQYSMMLLSKRLLHINLPILPFWLVISVLITLRYKPEVFHNLICPFGALAKDLWPICKAF
jgi:ferredoxin-type protein NapH